VQIKHILAVADTDKLSYKDAVKQVATTSKTLPVKTVQNARNTTNIGSSITSARSSGVNIATKTVISNENSARLESKLDLVLNQIATLSSHFDHEISSLRKEVSDRNLKIMDDLTEDAANREKHLDAKLRIITSNVALQQEQLEALSHLNSRVAQKNEQLDALKTNQDQLNIAFGKDIAQTSKQTSALIQFKDSLKGFDYTKFKLNNKSVEERLSQMQVTTTELDTKTTELDGDVEANLERIRKRCRLYDTIFRILARHPSLKIALQTVHDEAATVSPNVNIG